MLGKENDCFVCIMVESPAVGFSPSAFRPFPTPIFGRTFSFLSLSLSLSLFFPAQFQSRISGFIQWHSMQLENWSNDNARMIQRMGVTCLILRISLVWRSSLMRRSWRWRDACWCISDASASLFSLSFFFSSTSCWMNWTWRFSVASYSSFTSQHPKI